jgi:hypothetical protein
MTDPHNTKDRHAAPRRPRRDAQHGGRGLPRTSVLTTAVDAEIMERFMAEATRRGLTRAGLLGAVIENVVEDDLWRAVIDE